MMSHSNVEKMYPRSPRYVLQMKDKKVLRYAPYPRGNRAFFTEIINLSETGMAFTVPYLDSPHKNEIIMVEFTPPGGTAVACFAQVKRVDKFTIIEPDFFQKNCRIVAVKFIELNEAQQEMIRQGLGKEFKKIQRHFRRQQFILKMQWLYKFRRQQLIWSTVAAGSLITALALIAY